MAPQNVEVCVPDGIAEGEEFLLEFQGLQLSVACPPGCGPGDAINIEIDVPEDSTASAPQQVEVVVPDGCYPGMEFTVEFDGRQFNIGVPDGCEPGTPIMVEVPASEPAPAPAPAPSKQRAIWSSDEEDDDLPSRSRPGRANGGRRGGGSTSQLTQEERDAELARQLQEEEDELDRREQEELDARMARSLQGKEIKSAASTSTSTSTSASSSGAGMNRWRTGAGEAPSGGWAPAAGQSLFAMGPSDGYGSPAGDFHVGQLVQVTRSDGTWTYGKVMEYDSLGDTYSVMTRAGPKHMVERDSLIDDVVINPSDGSCAQQ